MGLLDLFGRRSKRFWSEEAYRSAVARQVAMVPATLEKLVGFGVSDEDLMKLEYFFYTDTVSKASALACELAELGYEVERRPSSTREEQSLVTGWTRPLRMGDDAVTAWVRKMCALGRKYDCEFDGWGTSPGR